MLRSAASPGSVGFGRHGGGASGLLMTPFPAGHPFCLPAVAVWRPILVRSPRMSSPSRIR